MKTAFALAAASLAMSGAALAQNAPSAQTPPPPPSEQAPPAAAPAAPQAVDVSDDQVERFALAALKVEQIAADETMEPPQKQTMMATAVQESGMDAQEFNTIAQASQADPALLERIQSAAAAHVEAAQAQSGESETGTP